MGDFSFYDHVLDMSFTLGNVPERARRHAGSALEQLFRVARGRARDADADAGAHEGHAACGHAHGTQKGAQEGEVAAGEMTKWFDTNYHYIVPELHADTAFSLDASRLLAQLAEAKEQGVKARPVIIGPVTYLALGKTHDGSDRLALLPRLLPVYAQLLERLHEAGAEWVQVDEPLLVTDLDEAWRHAFNTAYHHLKGSRAKLLLATYFGALGDNRYLAAHLPVAGLHVDAVAGREDVQPLLGLLPAHRVLSLGVIHGRNVWKSDLTALLDWLEPLAGRLGERLWLAPSCSLLHVPVDLAQEDRLDAGIRDWLAFALQKLDELQVLGTALRQGREVVRAQLQANQAALAARRASTRAHLPAVQEAVRRITPAMEQRASAFAQRAARQAAWLKLPAWPTTTIGSFPQTAQVRHARSEYKAARLDEAAYRQAMRAEIERAIREQEALGLDVLVHGEAERNDMVEYFGEQLEGYAFTRFGWVQSYGSRCVKPPILFGDIRRPHAMTLEWATWAQSLTPRPVKGMLTGPVTLLNWSFVRDDQPRPLTCSWRWPSAKKCWIWKRRALASSRLTSRPCARACPCAASSGRRIWTGPLRAFAWPPTACATKRKSTPTCATRSSTTSSAPSRRWTPTSSPSKPRARTWSCWTPLWTFTTPTTSAPACTTSTRPTCPRKSRSCSACGRPPAAFRPNACGSIRTAA